MFPLKPGPWHLFPDPLLHAGQLVPDLEESRLHAFLPSIPGRNHASQLCWSGNGDLLCVWMGGAGEGQAGMSIYLSRLTESSTLWSEPVCISEDQERSEQNPLLWSMPDGTLHLLHTAQRVRANEDDDGGAFSMQWTARLRTRHSTDDGYSWSPTVDLTDSEAFCRNPPLFTASSNLLLPIYRSLQEGNLFGHDYTEVLCMNQALDSHHFIEVPRSIGRVHGSIVQSEDKSHLIQFFRSRLADRVYRSIGSLDGATWSEPEPTLLPNNNSSIQAYRLSSGRLALIFNRFSLPTTEPLHWGDARWPYTRWPLSIALSEDDGLTWPYIRDLLQGSGYSGEANWHSNTRIEYPSILEGPASVIHVSCSWGNQSCIRYMRLFEADILNHSR